MEERYCELNYDTAQAVCALWTDACLSHAAALWPPSHLVFGDWNIIGFNCIKSQVTTYCDRINETTFRGGEGWILTILHKYELKWMYFHYLYVTTSVRCHTEVLLQVIIICQTGLSCFFSLIQLVLLIVIFLQCEKDNINIDLAIWSPD